MATGNLKLQLYYTFDNANNANISNILLNNAYTKSNNVYYQLPVTSNLYARYEAKNYNPTTKIWTDSGPNSRNIPASSVTGTPTVVTNNANLTNTNGLYNSYVAVKGGINDRINLGNDQLNSWTLFAIVRYAGGSKGRILASNPGNFLTGHHGGTAGVAYHEGWLTSSTIDYYGNNFFINTDTASKMYTNGVIRGTTGNGVSYLPPLYINNDPFLQYSDWEVIDIIFYNAELSDENKRAVEFFLSSYYGIADSDTTKSVLSAVLYNSPTFSTTDYKIGASSLVLNGTSSQYVQLPSFYTTTGTGLTFAMWFKSNNSGEWARLFDFGNGAADSNILAAISGNNLVLGVYGATGVCQPGNVLPDCNDNVWRHLVWTISSDGLTWKVYINGSLYATITAANVSSYSQQGGVGPNYPNNVLRTKNYIGKSNWPDAYLKGSVDDFYFYNSAIEQTDVTKLYNSSLIYTVNDNISFVYSTGTIAAHLGSTDPPGWVICDGVTRTTNFSSYAALISMNIGTSTVNSYTPPDLRGAFLRGSNLGTATNASTSFSGVNYGANAPTLGSFQNHATEVHSHTANSSNQNVNHTHSGTTSGQSANHTHGSSDTSTESTFHTHNATTGNNNRNHIHDFNDAWYLENSGNAGTANNGGSNNNDNDNKYYTTNNHSFENNANHYHNTSTTNVQSASHTHTGNTGGQAANHTHTFQTGGQSANHTHNITVNNSTTNSSTSESRPYNYGVNYIVKL